LGIGKEMNKILSIVIPVYNKFNFTKSCLGDLSKLPNDHEIIIVDNGSTDQTKSELEHSKEIKYYRMDTNCGFAKGCNYGFNCATAPNVLFLNNDIRVRCNHTDWTKSLIDKCSTSLCGPTMGQLDNDLNFVQEANRVLAGKSYLSGWCIASSKSIWNKLDLPRKIPNDMIITDCHMPQIFSEEFGIAYFEDTDLSFRAKKLGIPLEVVDVPVVHFGKQTSSQLNTYQLYKSAREIFVNKWQK
jgi:GT2 family glycosyltransferase